MVLLNLFILKVEELRFRNVRVIYILIYSFVSREFNGVVDFLSFEIGLFI